MQPFFHILCDLDCFVINIPRHNGFGVECHCEPHFVAWQSKSAFGRSDWWLVTCDKLANVLYFSILFSFRTCFGIHLNLLWMLWMLQCVRNDSFCRVCHSERKRRIHLDSSGYRHSEWQRKLSCFLSLITSAKGRYGLFSLKPLRVTGEVRLFLGTD